MSYKTYIDAGPSPAGGPVVPGPPHLKSVPPHVTFGPPVAAYIQYCILKIWPPLLVFGHSCFLAPPAATSWRRAWRRARAFWSETLVDGATRKRPTSSEWPRPWASELSSGVAWAPTVAWPRSRRQASSNPRPLSSNSAGCSQTRNSNGRMNTRTMWPATTTARLRRKWQVCYKQDKRVYKQDKRVLKFTRKEKKQETLNIINRATRERWLLGVFYIIHIFFFEENDRYLVWTCRDPTMTFSDSMGPILNSRDPNRVPKTP